MLRKIRRKLAKLNIFAPYSDDSAPTPTPKSVGVKEIGDGYIKSDIFHSYRFKKDHDYRVSEFSIPTRILTQLAIEGVTMVCIHYSQGREAWSTLRNWFQDGKHVEDKIALSIQFQHATKEGAH